MAGYGQPDWVNAQNNNNSAVVSEANVAPGVTASENVQNGQGSSSGSGGCILCMLSILNMGLAVLMAALGVLTLMAVSNGGVNRNDSGADDSSSSNNNRTNMSEPFLAFYMILFAVLLFCYELMWWSPVTGLNDSMRKNFGFMYGLRGKGLYLIFVAFLCFGLGREARVLILNYFTGILFLIGGLLHMFIICYQPETALQYQPPGQKSSATADPNQNVV